MHEIATKYNSYHRKHRYELAEEAQNYVNRIFIDEKLAIKVIMDCRTTSAHKCGTRLGFNHCNKKSISANKSNTFIWRRKYENTI